MKELILALALLTIPASAQAPDPAMQALQFQSNLGSCLTAHAQAEIHAKNLTVEIAKLKSEIEELKKAKSDAK